MISLIISVVCKLKCPSNYNFLSIDFVFHNVYVCPIICHSLKNNSVQVPRKSEDVAKYFDSPPLQWQVPVQAEVRSISLI